MKLPPSSPLENQLILVTGGTRGIGQAICERLQTQGARVIATSRRATGFPARPPQSGAVAEVPLDVNSEASVKALFQWLDEQLLKDPSISLYGLVNNAGVGTFKPLDQLTLEEFESNLRTNVTGSFLCARESIQRMKKTGGGRIIQIGSISDHLLLPDNGAYAASKFAARALVGIINEENKAHRIHASLVSPGATYTEIWQGREGFDRSDMLDVSEIARTVEDILARPLGVRIDEVRILPTKGVL
jgi:NAD(P)-dependent dehydrogenase (short-subunit alcohol dehydrogenase family)